MRGTWRAFPSWYGLRGDSDPLLDGYSLTLVLHSPSEAPVLFHSELRLRRRSEVDRGQSMQRRLKRRWIHGGGMGDPSLGDYSIPLSLNVP